MKRSLLLFAFCGAFSMLQAQAVFNKLWDRLYGGTDMDILISAIKTTDGGFLLGGYSNSGISGDKSQANAGLNDFWVIKVDSTGTKQWDQNFGGSGIDQLNCLRQTAEGGYILGGFATGIVNPDSSLGPYGQEDYWVIKLDSSGNKLWDRLYGGADWDELTALEQTSDGGYILGGFSYSGISGVKSQASNGNCDYWIIKIDSSGGIQWDQSFGGNQYDRLHAIHQTSDGGYIAAGTSSSGITGDKTENNFDSTLITLDYWLIKTDTNGNKIWDHTYGGKTDDDCTTMIIANDGGFLLCGESNSPVSGNKSQHAYNNTNDLWAVKTDSAGVIQWDKDMGGFDVEEFEGSIEQTSDNGYLLSGTSYSNFAAGNKSEGNLGQEQVWMLKISDTGVKLWDKTLFTPGHSENSIGMVLDSVTYVMAVSDNGVAGGYKSHDAYYSTLGIYSFDYWLIKFTATASITAIASLQPEGSLMVEPNPCTDMVKINVPQAETLLNLQVFDCMGNILLEKNKPSAFSTFNLNTAAFSNGIYLLKIRTSSGIYTSRLAVQH